MNNNLLISSLKYIFKELKENKNKIGSIAKQNMHQLTLRTSLGIWWTVFRDIIYFSVFIMFRYLMSGSREVEEMHFILYLMIGIIPWNFMSEVINGGVNAIKSNKSILSSIKFPITILPTVQTLAIFLKRLFTFLILLLVILFFGDIKNISLWMFIYYFLTMFIFMVIWNLIFSSLIAISNDFEQLYRAFTSVIFFTMPIIWSFEVIRPYPWLIRIFKLNPFVYIIEGFRDACHTGTLPDLEYTIYFWCLSALLFCIGSILQYKLRRHYIDLI